MERNAHEFQEELWIDYRLTFEALPALQKAVLQAMAEQSTAKLPFAPFKEDTLSIINGHLCQLDPKAKAPTATKIQKALESLREKEIVWRSGRGAYALEDGGMAEWLNRP